MMRITYLSTLVLLLCSFIANAQNIEIAFAYPSPPISINGNLDDWPDNIPKYDIKQIGFGNVEDDEDVRASFQLAYNTNAKSVYVGIEITDSDYINETANKTINEVDRVLLYIDPVHHPLGGTSVIFEGGEKYRDFGAKPKEWNPYLANLNWDNVELKTSRKGNTTTYEWQLKLGDVVKQNQVFGFDLIIGDTDKGDGDDDTWIVWTEGLGKSQSAIRLGEIILVEPDSKMGWIEGKVQTENDSTNQIRSVQIRSLEHSNLWVNTPVDSTGNFNTLLPISNYEIKMHKHFTSTLYSGGFKQNSTTLEAANAIMVQNDPTKAITAKPVMIKNNPLPTGFFEQNGILYQDDFIEHRVDHFIHTFQDYFDIPGVSVALVKNNAVIYNKAFGVKNNVTQEPLNTESLFEAASITKAVFSLMVLKQAERGVIDLDKPLYQYLAFPNIEHDPRHRQITARHVLNHQTGLDNWPIGSYSGQISDVKAELNFDPGTDFMYSGEAMNYLGRVLAKLCNKSLDQLFNEEIIPAFGLEHSRFRYDSSLGSEIALGHYHHFPFYKGKFDEVDSPASSLISSASDMSKLIIGLLNEEYLAQESYNMIYTPHTIIKADKTLYDADIPQSISHGFFFNDSPQGKIYGHGGNNGDFECKFGYGPEQGIGFAIFTNNNLGDEFIRLLELYLLRGIQNNEFVKQKPDITNH